MYKQTKTRKKFIALSGAEYVPVATLVDEHNDGVCHITIDDGCYICFLHVDESGFVPITHIFPELHEVLAILPPPDAYDEEIE